MGERPGFIPKHKKEIAAGAALVAAAALYSEMGEGKKEEVTVAPEREAVQVAEAQKPEHIEKIEKKFVVQNEFKKTDQADDEDDVKDVKQIEKNTVEEVVTRLRGTFHGYTVHYLRQEPVNNDHFYVDIYREQKESDNSTSVKGRIRMECIDDQGAKTFVLSFPDRILNLISPISADSIEDAEVLVRKIQVFTEDKNVMKLLADYSTLERLALDDDTKLGDVLDAIRLKFKEIVTN